MDLKTFVSEALSEIAAGIREAQAGTDGGSINAEGAATSSGNLIYGGNRGVFTRVDFDVAVSAESTGGGKGAIRVFGLGAEAAGEHRRSHANRFTFSVPVRLPDGNRSVVPEPRPVSPIKGIV